MALALPGAIAAGAAGAAAQGYDCAFATLCFGTEPCTASDWTARLVPAGGGLRLVSPGGDRDFAPLGAEDGHRAFVSAPENGAVALLTLGEDGTAIYSEQSVSGGFQVTEYGDCRESE
ncbi:hypothetical protein [Roseivivax sp. CAU 1761]